MTGRDDAAGLDATERDQLADYVGGALAGTADEQVVAGLIDTDLRWWQAHAELIANTEPVRAALAGWSAEPVVMPDDVVARLMASLSAATADQDISGAARTAEAGLAPVVPLDVGRRSRARRMGRRQWLTAATVAAAAVGFAALGLPHYLGGGQQDSSSSPMLAGPQSRTSAPASGFVDSTETAPLTRSGLEVSRRVTGRDYDRDSLSSAGLVGTATTPQALAVTGPLARLTSDAALAACLKQLVSGAPTGTTAITVDYATFEDAPALVVVLGQLDGRRWVAAVGPDCGLPGAGAALLHRTSPR